VQFDDTIQKWHTCKGTERIYATNPCVTGDTLVATAEGWRRIDALVGETARVIGADGLPHWVERIFPTGRKPVFRRATKAGYAVRITADHKVWTEERGDVAVKELKSGDHVRLRGAGFGVRNVDGRVAFLAGQRIAQRAMALAGPAVDPDADAIELSGAVE